MSVDEDGLRTEFVGSAQRHGGVDAELARRVGGGGDHAALMRLSADDDGLALERGIEELFDGDEEGVHVDVEVGPHAGLLAEMTRGRPARSARMWMSFHRDWSMASSLGCAL